MTAASRILLASIPLLVSIYTTRWRLKDEAAAFKQRDKNFNLPIQESFDFIIAGGGVAGCILANRLSKKFSVLLLEAGGHPPPIVDVPLLSGAIEILPEINFVFQTPPQTNAGLKNGGVLTIKAGKMLGGSGSHNGMQWEHGNSHDFDRWATTTRDESWNYENILKYFKQIENYQGKYSTNGYHGTSGPMSIVDSEFFDGQDLWFDAGKELGYQIRDSNGPQSSGFSPLSYNKQNGRRASTYTAYLKPILKKRRKRLKVQTYSFVTKVLFKNKTAIGVEYTRHGLERRALAEKEIILSTGTFISPIILFKSGIGPKDQVMAAKAPEQIMELPVGRNLLDHVTVPFPDIYLDDPKYSWSIDRNLTFNDIEEYSENQGGRLAGLQVEAEAFILSSRAQKEMATLKRGMRGNDWPDIQIYFNSSGTFANSVLSAISNSRPLSKGILTINSSAISMDDNYLPILNYNHFQIQSDIDVTIEGLNFVRNLVEKTKPFRQAGARFSKSPYKPCRTYSFGSKDYWTCYIRHKSSTGYHSCGTCRMGYGQADPEAVVDSKLRVIGVRRLRVVDASVMPFITNANICGPTIIIALKAANDILKAHHVI